MGAPVKVASKISNGFEIMEWTLKAGDVAELIELRSPVPSVQIAGDFGIGGICTIEGTNRQDVEPHRLLAAREPTIEAVAPFTRFVRPVVTGGDAKTNITVIMMVPQ